MRPEIKQMGTMAKMMLCMAMKVKMKMMTTKMTMTMMMTAKTTMIMVKTINDKSKCTVYHHLSEGPFQQKILKMGHLSPQRASMFLSLTKWALKLLLKFCL